MSRASSAALAAGAATATAGILQWREPSVERWQRRNYRDRTVTLTAGPALAAGLLAAATSERASGAVVAAAVGAGLGLYDDLRGDSHARGLRGHVRALREGRVTTGMVKLAGLAAAGLAAGVLDRRPATGHGAPADVLDVVVEAALVAGSANLVNLLDLRPGRALKVALLAGAACLPRPGAAGAVAAGLVASSTVMLPADLGEREMIGDCGANAAGAVVGWCLATGLDRTSRLLVLTGVVGLTLASERVSFTQVIERTPWLRAVDSWGRP